MAATPDSPDSYIGARLKRPDGPAKLTGEARYAADLVAARASLHVRLLLSPHAHARILRSNGDAAREVPGVVAVLTAPDLAPLRQEPANARVLAACWPTARSATAASPSWLSWPSPKPSPRTPWRWSRSSTRSCRPCSTADAALAPDAPAVWPDGLPGVGAEAAGHGVEAAGDASSSSDDAAEQTLRSPNVAAAERMDRGDVEAGLAEADVVIRRTYRTPIVHQGYIEPHATLAAPEPGGGLTIWSSTQGVFLPREETARVLGWSDSRIRLIPTSIGGGFGGKGVLLEPLAGVLAVMFRRPDHGSC